MERVAEFVSVFGETYHQKLIVSLKDLGFFEKPCKVAPYPGGLFDYSMMVMKCVMAMTEKMNLQWGASDPRYIIFFALSELGGKEAGDLSLAWLSQLGVMLTEQEALCIKYAYGGEDEEYEKACEEWVNIKHVGNAVKNIKRLWPGKEAK